MYKYKCENSFSSIQFGDQFVEEAQKYQKAEKNSLGNFCDKLFFSSSDLRTEEQNSDIPCEQSPEGGWICDSHLWISFKAWIAVLWKNYSLGSMVIVCDGLPLKVGQ